MDSLENDLKSLILKNLQFKVNNKIIKHGKLKIFNTKQFFIKFKMDNNGVVKEFELPYPYQIKRINDGFLFDYCLSAFVPKTESVFWKMKMLNSDNCSKLHDNYLYVIALSS